MFPVFLLVAVFMVQPFFGGFFSATLKTNGALEPENLPFLVFKEHMQNSYKPSAVASSCFPFWGPIMSHGISSAFISSAIKTHRSSIAMQKEMSIRDP